MSIKKDDLVWNIRVLGGAEKNTIGIVLRNPYEEIIKISVSPPVSEVVLCVDILVGSKIYKKIPLNQLEKVKGP